MGFSDGCHVIAVASFLIKDNWKGYKGCVAFGCNVYEIARARLLRLQCTVYIRKI